MVGKPGTGKSVLRKAIEKIGDDRKDYVVTTILRTLHTYSMILKQIVDAQGISIPKGMLKETEKKIISEVFNWHSQGKKIITIIEEAHLINFEVLKRLRLLFDSFPRNHNIILFAQNDIFRDLKKNVHADIRSRITFSAKMESLNDEQIKNYIQNEIELAQLPQNVFDDNAIYLILKSAEGNLRLARNLCYGSLVETVNLKQRIVTNQMVNRVLVQPHWTMPDEIIQEK